MRTQEQADDSWNENSAKAPQVEDITEASHRRRSSASDTHGRNRPVYALQAVVGAMPMIRRKARHSHPIRRLIAATMLLGWPLIAPSAEKKDGDGNSQAASHAKIADYFALGRISGLTMSSDGSAVVYTVSRASLTEDRYIRQVYLQQTRSDAAARSLPELADARDIRWIPGRVALSYIASVAGAAQLFALDLTSGKIEQVTHFPYDIQLYDYASDGIRVAAVAMDAPRSTGVFTRLKAGDAGVRLDTRQLIFRDFYIDRPDRPDQTSLWLLEVGKEPRRVDIPGNVGELDWEPDGRRVSVVYDAEREPRPAQLSDFPGWHSIGLVHTETGSFSPWFKAGLTPDGRAVSYQGGEWLSDGTGVLIRRVGRGALWIDSHYPDLGIADTQSGAIIGAWQPIQNYSGRFFGRSRNNLLVEQRVSGRNSLFRISTDSLDELATLRELRGSKSQFSLSCDGRHAAFVFESFNRPPEVYIQHYSDSAFALTNLNATLSGPAARDYIWHSKDQVAVHGWILTPPGKRPAAGWPLLTYIHGGPGFAYPDTFTGNFSTWPHPLEVLVREGIAVFIPNYRGTGSYGKAFKAAKTLDGEPVEDIATGIDHLIADGFADSKSLALAGHSHGAWLGPLIMTRQHRFRVASFAEGWSNFLTLYTLTGADHNAVIYDWSIGVSLYDDPNRYLALSPDLHMKGAGAALLLEAGSESGNAPLMTSLDKAARQAGMPSEFFVYPRTAHSAKRPRIQQASAQLNLDWFKYWLLGTRDSDPSKAEQYSRWDALRARTSWLESAHVK